MLFAASATTVMLHASHSPLAAWPWLALAVVIKGLSPYVPAEIPQRDVDTARSLLEKMRAAFRVYTEAAMAREAARTGVTPAAAAASASRTAYLAEWANVRRAGEALRHARARHYQALNAARETARVLREAKDAFRTARAEALGVEQPYDEAKEHHTGERVRSRFGLRGARREAEASQRVFAIELRVGCAGPHHEALLESYALNLNLTTGYIRVLLGEQSKRELSLEEKREIVRRRLAGTPTWILAKEYMVTKRHIRRLLSEDRDVDGGDNTDVLPSI